MSILSTAYSGLNAFQRALDVTGNNITNATTQGYSRQTINFVPTSSSRFAGSYIGAGVKISSVTRNVDQFASFQTRSSLSVKSQYDAYYQQASQIDKLLSQSGVSLSSSLQGFFDALGQLNNAPDSASARNVALKQTQLLTSQFNSLQNQLDDYQSNSTTQISQATQQMNMLTKSIAAVNTQLMGSADDPSLLDQRDNLLVQLSQYADITVIDGGNGTISVGIASGEMLVTGSEQRDLVVGSGDAGTQGTILYLDTGNGQLDVTSRVNSGMLGGLLDYEHDVLGKTSQMIGQMAIGLAQTFNAQHKLGMDMNDQIGRDFFTDYNSNAAQLDRVIAGSSNAVPAPVMTVEISDFSQTKLSDYTMRVVSGGQVELTRKSDGVKQTLPWTDTTTIPAPAPPANPPAPPAGQIIFEGMTINVSDVSQLGANDQFTLLPTRGAARDFALQITDSRDIALASPIKTSADSSNTGQGAIALGTVFNTSAVHDKYRVDISSSSPNEYMLVNVTAGTSTGPFTWTANSNNTISIPDATNPSYTVTLSGTPNVGDKFNMDFNSGGIGDNRNGLTLASIQKSKVFSGGTESLVDRYATLISDVGSQTSQAKLRGDSADVLYRQAIDFQDSKSGVNLDEEAANLLKYKQAYEAAGKLLQVSSQMMSVIFDMMR